MSVVAWLPLRVKLLLLALFWVVLPTPSYRQPIAAGSVMPVVAVGDDGSGPEVFWDPSPDVPTARFAVSRGTTDALVEVRPPSPVVGEPVQVRVSATDGRGRGLMSSVRFGAGLGRLHLTHADCFASSHRQAPREAVHPSHRSHVFEYVFHAAGRHPLRASVQLLQCGNSEEFVVPGELEVRSGHPRPNQRPITGAAIDLRQESSGPYAGEHLFTVRVSDPDGFLHHAHVDFGDGSEPEVFSEEHRWLCRDTPARHVGFEETSTLGYHSLPGRSRLTIRATITTTSCDKTHPQTTTVTRTVTTQ